MATATDSNTALNVSADTAAFTLKGGRYVLTVAATFGGGNVQLQILAADGSTWVAPKDIGGSANNLTAAGSQTIDLPACQARFHVVTATAVYASVARVLP